MASLSTVPSWLTPNDALQLQVSGPIVISYWVKRSIFVHCWFWVKSCQLAIRSTNITVVPPVPKFTVLLHPALRFIKYLFPWQQLKLVFHHLKPSDRTGNWAAHNKSLWIEFQGKEGGAQSLSVAHLLDTCQGFTMHCQTDLQKN